MLFSQLMCVVTVAVTSLASTGEPASSEDDRACFVPPTERPRSDLDEVLLFELHTPISLYDIDSYLVYPDEACGIEVFFYFEDLFLDPAYQEIITFVAASLPLWCNTTVTVGGRPGAEAVTILPRLQVLTSGTNPAGEHISFVPASDLTRVPSEWLTGLVLLISVDYLEVGHHTILCSAPYLKDVENSQYNLNVTLEINGCPSGRHGGQCEQLCACAVGVECHSFSGACLCPIGLQGARCDQRNPVLSVDDQAMYVVYGDRVDLTCTIRGMSPISYSWTKDDQTMSLEASEGEIEVPYSPRPITLTAVLWATGSSVNGMYTCTVRDDNGAVYRRHVNVTVIAIPDPFVEVPQNRTVLVGSNVTLTCAIRPDAGAVRWVRGHGLPDQGSEVTDESGRLVSRLVAPFVSQLSFREVQFPDEGAYRCFAGHIFQEPDLYYAQAVLTVQSDPVPECSFGDVVIVPSGESLTLSCFLPQAKPAPRLVWTLVGSESTADLPEPRTTSVPAGDGVSRNVTTSVTFVPAPEDDGKTVSLTVVTPPPSATRQVMTSLNVTYSPIVTISPDPVTLTVGQTVTVRCMARGNPGPSAYAWTLGCPDLPVTRTGDRPNHSEFVIAKATAMYDRSNLTCRVANSVGEQELTVQIMVAEPASSTGMITGFSVAGGLCVVLLVLASLLIHRHRREINLWWAKRAGKNKAKGDKTYDVFISYKSGGTDEDFVVRSLIPRLEADGYHICVHYRSFVPGRSIIDNIADAVHWSRKTVLLLSPDFLESEWCRYEFQAALSQMLHLRTDLVPVVLTPLGPAESLCPDLQTMLRTLSYIAWPEGDADRPGRDAEEERFWKLLRQSMPDTPLEREGRGPDPEDDISSSSVRSDSEAFELDGGRVGLLNDLGPPGGESEAPAEKQAGGADMGNDHQERGVPGNGEGAGHALAEVACGPAHDEIQLIGV